MAQKKRKGARARKQRDEAGGDSDTGEFDVSAGVPEQDEVHLPSFPAADEGSDTELDTRQLVRAQNKKKKKSGGFQSMGLGYPVFKGVMKKGYKVPTPIQRKVIPVILDGKDVVAMARTGSGKTACFLIPMFEKLKAHSAQTGVRGLILSPTRELALQTLKFTKELGKFTGLKTALILGGDRMEDQFAALHENPDIIIATPGRLMHVAVEMNLKLRSVEYVVFDEADRLFEMGFAEQLQEIISRLPDTRQTLLFSATLPKMLLEFARAGLTEPVLIRLDVDSKLSEQLTLSFLHVRAEDKPAVLLHLLRCIVKPQEQTVIFVATKHHAEYLKELLDMQGIPCSHIYSALDQTARKINLGLFLHGKVRALLVTDVAARGIDIPMLDNVINYNFPPKAKLFLHRVGRVARAGRSGTAYSLVAPDETPYVYDLHLFVGRPLKLAGDPEIYSVDTDGVMGRVPQSLIDDEDALLITDRERSLDLQNLHRVAENAYIQYSKSRPAPAPESIKRVKAANYTQLGVHPLFWSRLGGEEMQRLKFVDCIKSYKSKATIFEINASNKTPASEVMRAKRSRDLKVITKFQRLQDEKVKNTLQSVPSAKTNVEPIQDSAEESIEGVFSQVLGKRKREDRGENEKKKKKAVSQDSEYYVPYRPKDFESERGLSVAGNSFEQAAAGAELDLLGDQTQDLRKTKHVMKWDRKKKKFVGAGGHKDTKKIKTESGRVISSSYKTNIYQDWKKKYKIDDQDSEEDEDRPTGKPHRKGRGAHRGSQGTPRSDSTGPRGKPKSELRNKQQILKQRKAKAKQLFLQKGGMKKLKRTTRQRMQQMKKSAFGRGKSSGFKKGKMR
ncbi:ATP-dependent RNA helicase DDX54 isoform X3 [Eleutherodactylus coqui]|uniref:ATP-dependent RNA helicase DDX54 isoform X3 n=1 Tax=Eleutherodactylus coqui TaxID=57060 RepID=UPI003461BC8E